MTEKVTEQLFKEWLQHPVTEVLRQQWAANQLFRLQQEWSNGGFTHVDPYATIQANQAAVGACSVYVEVRDLDFESFIGAITDEK